MSVFTYDDHLDTLEKNFIIMMQEITAKIDESNSILTSFKEVLEDRGRAIKDLADEVKTCDICLSRVEVGLEKLTQSVRAINKQQDVQGQDTKDMKGRLDSIDQRLDGIDQRFASMEKKFDKCLE